MKYLERRLDEVLSRIMEQNEKVMDQNTRLISAVVLMGDEIKDLRHSMSNVKEALASPSNATAQPSVTPPAPAATFAPGLPTMTFGGFGTATPVPTPAFSFTSKFFSQVSGIGYRFLYVFINDFVYSRPSSCCG